MCYPRKYISKLNHGNACTVSKNYLHWHEFWSCEIFPSVSGFPSFLFKFSQSTYAHRSMWCWFCPCACLQGKLYSGYHLYSSTSSFSHFRLFQEERGRLPLFWAGGSTLGPKHPSKGVRPTKIILSNIAPFLLLRCNRNHSWAKKHINLPSH